MFNLDKDRPIVMRLGTAVAVVALLLLGAWGIAERVAGSIENRIADVQAQIVELRGTDDRLRDGASGNEAGLAALTGRLDAIQASVDGLKEDMAKADKRQRAFEAYVVPELQRITRSAGIEGPAPFLPMSQGAKDFIDQLSQGPDPLSTWSDLMAQGDAPTFQKYGPLDMTPAPAR